MDKVLQPCQHVRGVVSSGINPVSWVAHRELAAQMPINVSLGLHPFFVTPESDALLDELAEYLDDPAVLAVGEIGLDFHKEAQSAREAQRPVFERQLQLAVTRALPIIIHCRKAHDVLFDCLEKVRLPAVIFHAFSGSQNDHMRAMDRGDYVSFGFPITYADNKKQREMLMQTPLERIMLETDAPYMKRLGTPDEHTTPDDIRYVYEAAAALKGVSLETLIATVRENVRRVWPQFREF